MLRRRGGLSRSVVGELAILAREYPDPRRTEEPVAFVSVLESLPGLGKVKARRMMEELGISEQRRLQGLGTNQREAVLKATQK